jgi:hypothetical protein
MSQLQSRIRRIIVAGSFALTVAVAPAVAFFVAPATGAAPTVTACPAGETEDVYTNICVAEMSPNVAGGSYPTLPPGGSVPEVGGVPCTGANTGQCIGLQEAEGGVPQVTPHSSLSSSP